jgi:hypothetical protein
MVEPTGRSYRFVAKLAALVISFVVASCGSDGATAAGTDGRVSAVIAGPGNVSAVVIDFTSVSHIDIVQNGYRPAPDLAWIDVETDSTGDAGGLGEQQVVGRQEAGMTTSVEAERPGCTRPDRYGCELGIDRCQQSRKAAVPLAQRRGVEADRTHSAPSPAHSSMRRSKCGVARSIAAHHGEKRIVLLPDLHVRAGRASLVRQRLTTTVWASSAFTDARQPQPERAPLARFAFDFDVSAEKPAVFPCRRKPDPHSSRRPDRAPIHLPEPVEDVMLVFGRDADAGVADLEDHTLPLHQDAKTDLTGVGVLHRILAQVDQDPASFPGIRLQRDDFAG